MLEQNIGFVGAGQMATALGQGFVRAELIAGSQLLAADPVADAAARFAEATGASTAKNNLDLVERADVVFLAVKPQQLGAVLEEIRGALTPDKLVVSIAAGVPLATMAGVLGDQTRLVRVMPNTPCLVGRGACGFCLGAAAKESDAANG